MKRCENCDKLITGIAHKVDDVPYCSAECAIESLTDEYIMNAKEQAKEDYNNGVRLKAYVDACSTCDKLLIECETIWAVYGELFCSPKCGIEKLSEIYGANAETIFNMAAEEINPRDIGIGGENYE